MLKTVKPAKVELDSTIDEQQRHSYIDKKVAQARKTLKRVGLPTVKRQ